MIKKRIGLTVLLLIMIGTSGLFAEDIRWLTDYDEALEMAGRTGQNVFLLLTAPSWCGYCIKLENETFPDEDVAGLINDGFIPVMITDENPQINRFDFRGYPTMRIMDAGGRQQSEAVGFRPPRDLIMWAVDYASEGDDSGGDGGSPQNRGRVDAVLDAGRNRIYLIKGSWVLLYDFRSISPVAGYPKRISEEFPGVPDDIDAAVSWSSSSYYFFKGDQYWRVSSRNNSVDSGYPKPFTPETWSGLELLEK